MAGAKVYFILVGLVQQVALKAVLGLQGYGDLSTVLSAASITYNPIVSTSIQGVSRAVASSPEAEQAQAARRTLLVHTAMAVVAALGFFVLAGPVSDWMGAPHVAPALRILSAVLLLYGIYTPLVGALNGKQRFLAQAGLDVFAATLRTIGLIGGAWWLARQAALTGAAGEAGAAGVAGAAGAAGWGGVEGASLGFVAGAVIVMVVALWLVGTGKAGPGGTGVKQHLAFIAPLLGGQVLLNLLFQADAILLRRFSSEAALTAGLSVEAAGDLVGAYRAAQLFCFLPYQLLLAVTFILFPMLASAHRDGDDRAVAEYVRGGVRLALVIAGLMVSVTCGLPGPLVHLVFGADAAKLAGGPMQLLSLGLGAFALFGIFTSVLNSLKHERASLGVTLLAFVLVVALCFWRVPAAEFGVDVLWRTAQATALALVLATLGAAWLVKRASGAVVSPLSLVRVAVAMGIAIAAARVLPPGGKLMTIVYAAVVATVYAVVLLVSRELGKRDLAHVKAVVSRKRG